MDRGVGYKLIALKLTKNRIGFKQKTSLFDNIKGIAKSNIVFVVRIKENSYESIKTGINNVTVYFQIKTL